MPAPRPGLPPFAFMTKVFTMGPKLAMFGGAAAVFGSWLIYPALTDNFKRTVGILPPLPEEES